MKERYVNKIEEEYVKRKGNFCIHCRSENIEGTGKRNYDDNWYTNEIRCNDCGKIWDDFYMLTGVIQK